MRGTLLVAPLHVIAGRIQKPTLSSPLVTIETDMEKKMNRRGKRRRNKGLNTSSCFHAARSTPNVPPFVPSDRTRSIYLPNPLDLLLFLFVPLLLLMCYVLPPFGLPFVS